MNYYNEFDKHAASWLRELIADDLIPKGEVDERSITEVRPADLRGYRQCHFFAGIGGWPLAGRIAGLPDDYEWWSGSCPCQAFSTAGKGGGFSDPRGQLWHTFAALIRECRPPVVFGEQVAAAIKFGWLDGVYEDLEAENYACGSVVLGAHSVGAPHQRQRLYWCGVAESTGARGRRREPSHDDGVEEFGRSSADGGMAAVTEVNGRGGRDTSHTRGRCERVLQATRLGNDGGMADCYNGNERSRDMGQSVYSKTGDEREADRPINDGGSIGTLDAWCDSTWIACRDGKYRRVPTQPVFQRVASRISCCLDDMRAEDGFPLAKKEKGSAHLLKGYGNAIVPQVAAAFIKAAFL